jgi:hypothetical protein
LIVVEEHSYLIVEVEEDNCYLAVLVEELRTSFAAEAEEDSCKDLALEAGANSHNYHDENRVQVEEEGFFCLGNLYKKTV